MNETITTLSDLPKDEHDVAKVIIKVIKGKYEQDKRKYQEGKVSELVPLENIRFGIADLEGFLNIMQGIAPYQPWEKTAQQMLGTLSWTYGEIERYSEGVYNLTKHGYLYKYLTEKLARTS